MSDATLRNFIFTIEKQEARIAELEAALQARAVKLEAENASLTANQCIHGIHGDERGNSYCPRIAELEAALATARNNALEEAAKVAQGEVYLHRYRTWAWWKEHPDYGRGNRAEESELVIHCDAIAAAIRAMKDREP